MAERAPFVDFEFQDVLFPLAGGEVSVALRTIRPKDPTKIGVIVTRWEFPDGPPSDPPVVYVATGATDRPWTTSMITLRSTVAGWARVALVVENT